MESGCIETFSGKMIYPLKPEENDIIIDDIAHSLSMQCRFNGHCKCFYSVAEHSVNTAKVAEMLFPNIPQIVIFSLLHDASEAYLCDIPRPIKSSFTDYLDWEKRLSDVILNKFAYRIPSEKEEELILKADNIMLATESYELTFSKGADWGLSEQILNDIDLFCWTPEEAKKKFLQKFEKLK